MRVAVLGPQGSLGIHLCEELRLAGHEVDPIDRAVCDLGTPDRESLYRLRDRFAGADCQLVINTAAFTDVDAAEHKTDEAFMVNAIGAEPVSYTHLDVYKRQESGRSLSNSESSSGL